MTSLTDAIQHLQLPQTDESPAEAQRLFHGRGHAYPGLHHVTVDWFPPVVLITLFAEEDKKQIMCLAEYLYAQLPDCKSVQLQHRYLPSGSIDVLLGEMIASLVVNEAGLTYQISLGKARNHGLFLDMRNGRQWLREQAQQKRVLNLFSYTCGFSVAAIEGKASFVMNMDMSSPALSVGRENHRLNNHDLSSVRFDKLNIFKSFGRIKKQGPFDLLVCDPPTLQKGSVDIARDYPKIMRRLDEFMAKESQLMLCLNAPELGEDFILQHMKRLASDYRHVTTIKPPNVYREAEGKGLTIMCFSKQ
ncbi:MAG: Methyltransferase (EC [uncultured Thiotrichaceae bacterium]|uniref:Methyltransferase (EC) n=1 Tax=uncultured Thiotrichaceae bacterium TaxID=298394 RepID=A0A6S6U2S4_9GAMM|nr:MAG: Methyltransferase (EC [uncultured Thiotrichaceae bacterium]